MTCNKCGESLSDLKPIQMAGEFKGEQVTVEIEGRECASCGYQRIEGRRTAEFMRKVSDAVRAVKGLLSSEEMKLRREGLRMSQKEFAAFLGTGVASVKRWELGEIQTRAADELIRLKTDLAALEAHAEVLRELHRAIAPAEPAERSSVWLTLPDTYEAVTAFEDLTQSMAWSAAVADTSLVLHENLARETSSTYGIAADEEVEHYTIRWLTEPASAEPGKIAA